MIASELSEQAGFLAWFKAQYPRVLIFSVPNGAFLFGTADQRRRQMAKLKWQGLVPGIPDLLVPEWRLAVELKRTKGGRGSDEQAEVQAEFERIGWHVVVARGWADGAAKVRELRREAA